MRRPAFAAAVLLLSLSAAAEPLGSLAGAVRTPDGRPLPQVVLTVSGPAGSRTLVTGPDGRYRASGLVAGEYRVALATPGFVLSPEPTASVGERDERLDLTLSPAPVREHVVVAATRGDAALSTLGVSASALDREQIADRQASSFLELLRELPGVAVARTGGPGLQASAFLRGGEARYARVLVDGVPVNQPGGAFDFGSALPLELERVEVVRGAESSLYGTDALAGVIHIVTRRADAGEAPGVHAEAAAGSFAWRQFLGGTSGRAGGLDWNAGLLRLDTENEQPNSAFVETAGAFSGGARLDDRTSLHLVVRAEDSSAGTAGPTSYGRPDLDAGFERTDVTLGGELRRSGNRALHELRFGLAKTNQLSLDPIDSGSFIPRSGDRVGPFPVSDFPSTSGFQNDTDRLSFGYKAELQAGTRHLLTAGADVERETGASGVRDEELLSPKRTNAGVYLQDRLVLADRVYLTLGGRLERNDSFGWKAVPRAAVAWHLRGGASATTLKASAGAGIKEPDFFQSFGVSFFAKGNPDLKPERSRTFDVGVEQRGFGGRLRAEATFFHHDYLDQIAYTVLDFTTFAGSYLNLGKTRAQGVELRLEAAPSSRLRLSAGYTYLDGVILASTSDFDPVYAVGEPLLRRPKHQASLSAQAGGARLGAGLSLLLVGRRADSDFLGLGLTENPGYARVDVRAHAQLRHGLTAFVSAENLLDRRYEEALGFPALGRGVRAGLRYRSGTSKP
jgi:outer membrane cobalamin receptor